MRILSICLLTLCLYRGQILHAHLLHESRAARHIQKQNMPFPFLPSLFSEAYSPLPCTVFVLLPFFGVFQWHCWQQEELWTAWISRSFMGNCDGGRVRWAFVMLLTCIYRQYKSTLENTPARRERSENTELLRLDAGMLLTSQKSFKWSHLGSLLLISL